VDRDAIFTQAMFLKVGVGGVRHQVDLHWRVSNRPFFRHILSFDELWPGSVAIAGLGGHARTPDAVHALLLACIHPVAHHYGEWPLIWLHDVWLLAQGLSTADWDRFRELAFAKKVSLLCRRTLRLTAEALERGSWLEKSLVAEWPHACIEAEPSAEYLDQQGRSRQDLMLDLHASDGIVAKCRLLLSHAFPDVSYMRRAYGASGWLGLASAYGRRLSGAGVQLTRLDPGTKG